jgi:hypothetical protein
MQVDIRKIASICFFYLRWLSSASHYRSRHSSKPRFCTDSFQDWLYCYALLAGLPTVILAPLRRVMNAAVRFVAGSGPLDQTSDAQREFHWLFWLNSITTNYALWCTLWSEALVPSMCRIWYHHSAGAPICAPSLLDSWRPTQKNHRGRLSLFCCRP